MKTRSDFVSNSSSSSYIVAIDFGQYDVELFVARTCDRCGRGCEHMRGAKKDRFVNEAVLRNGLLSEALYVGIPTVGRVKETWHRGENYDHTYVKPGEGDEYTPFRELTDERLSYGRRGTVRRVGEDAIEYEYDDELPAWLPVPRQTMQCCIRNYEGLYELERGMRGRGPKARAARIVHYAKRTTSEKLRRYEPEVFCITKNTIANTRDLVAAGYKVEWLVDGEKLEAGLDKLETRLKAGETIVYAVAGDSGEGVVDTRLYMPYGYSNPFEDTPAELLTDFCG